MVAILGLLFAFNSPVGKPEAGIRASRSVKPVAVISGQNHLLKEDTFCLVNSQAEADKLLLRAFGDREPIVDFDSYSLICIFHKKKQLLTGLDFLRLDESERTFEIKYVEHSITQIFMGLNDNVANAPYLLIVVPKWKGDVVFHSREGTHEDELSIWSLKHRLRSKKQPRGSDVERQDEQGHTSERGAGARRMSKAS
jgi:hypothetical protein